MPAGTLIRAVCRQVATGSLHASTRYVQSPGAPGVTSAPQRSLPGASSRIGVQGPGRPSGSFSTTLAATASCPSRNTVAVTSNVSPVTAFAGRLPCSTTGRTSRTGIRPIPAVALIRISPPPCSGPGVRPADWGWADRVTPRPTGPCAPPGRAAPAAPARG